MNILNIPARRAADIKTSVKGKISSSALFNPNLLAIKKIVGCWKASSGEIKTAKKFKPSISEIYNPNNYPGNIMRDVKGRSKEQAKNDGDHFFARNCPTGMNITIGRSPRRLQNER